MRDMSDTCHSVDTKNRKKKKISTILPQFLQSWTTREEENTALNMNFIDCRRIRARFTRYMYISLAKW